MVTIYRLTDRIPVKVGELTFWLSPLSSEQKSKLGKYTMMSAGERVEKAFMMTIETIRMGVKKVDGLIGSDGLPYELEFGADGSLTEDCAAEISQVDGCDKIAKLIIRWGVSDNIKTPEVMREEYEKRLNEQLASGLLDENAHRLAMGMFFMDGVTVDFSKVENVKKKSLGSPQVQ